MSICLAFVIISLTLRLVIATKAVKISFDGLSFGPDGPWQAIKVNIASTKESQMLWAYPNLFMEPDIFGGRWTVNAELQLKDSCRSYDNSSITNCGLGGFWESESDSDSSNTTHNNAAFGNNTFGLDQTLRIQRRSSNLPPLEGSIVTDARIAFGGNSVVTIANMTLALVSKASRILPNNTLTGWPLGNIHFGSENGEPGEDSIVTQLFKAGIIPSNTVGVHIGSAALEQGRYPGSLYLGGYDKGRTVGPYTSFIDKPMLLNVGFNATKDVDRLRLNELIKHIPSPEDNSSSRFNFLPMRDWTIPKSSNLPVSFVGSNPYINLPQELCQIITSFIPVKLDPVTKFYLWDTQSPRYTLLMQSSTYLGFEFRAAPGQPGSVEIKVPFQLLSLTLETPYSMTAENVSYFPCVRSSPDQSRGGQDQVILGRAFLQAASIIHNYDTGVTWLAQAPGPGRDGHGVGEVPTDIIDNRDTLDTFVDTHNTLLIQSWDRYQFGVGLTPRGSEDGLSTAAKTGIGIGVTIGICLIIGFCIGWRRSRRRNRTIIDPKVDITEPSQPERAGNPQELPTLETHQLDSAQSQILELHPQTPVGELTGHNLDGAYPPPIVELPGDRPPTIRTPYHKSTT